MIEWLNALRQSGLLNLKVLIEAHGVDALNNVFSLLKNCIHCIACLISSFVPLYVFSSSRPDPSSRAVQYTDDLYACDFGPSTHDHLI